MNSSESSAARRAVHAQMVEAGTPAGLASLIVDLGFHAAQTALESMATVAKRAPDTASSINVMMTAIGALRARIDTIEEGMRADLERAGMPYSTLTVEVPNG